MKKRDRSKSEWKEKKKKKDGEDSRWGRFKLDHFGGEKNHPSQGKVNEKWRKGKRCNIWI